MDFTKVMIRKYKSKKYYNMTDKCYVSKSELFDLFMTRSVMVVCAVTNEDITNIEIPRVSNGMLVDVADIKELFIKDKPREKIGSVK